MPEWHISPQPVPYLDAMPQMRAYVDAVRDRGGPERVWLLEHPACYTAGTSAQAQDLRPDARFPVYETGRGGQYTYHGPGQRIAYVVLDLQTRKIDIRDYVCRLEHWIIATLSEFGITGELRDGRIGIWVEDQGREDKIAALGVRVSRGVAFHGISLNVRPDLNHYSGIVPCGITQHGVTSMEKLGKAAPQDQIDAALQRNFLKFFAV